MSKEEVKDILSMSKKDQKKWLKEKEDVIAALERKAERTAANAPLENIASELSNINFTLLEIHSILKKGLNVQDTKPKKKQ